MSDFEDTLKKKLWSDFEERNKLISEIANDISYIPIDQLSTAEKCIGEKLVKDGFLTVVNRPTYKEYHPIE
jgi:hypothetical protein